MCGNISIQFAYSLVCDAWSHIHEHHVNKDDSWIESRVDVGIHQKNGDYKKVEFASTFYGYEKDIKNFLVAMILNNSSKIQERFLDTERNLFRITSALPSCIEGNLYNGREWADCNKVVMVLERVSANSFRIKTAYPAE